MTQPTPLTPEAAQRANEALVDFLHERDKTRIYRLSGHTLYIKGASSIGTYHPLPTESHDSLQLVIDVMNRDEKWKYAWALAGDTKGQSLAPLDETMLVNAVLATLEQKVTAALVAIGAGEWE